MKRGIRVTERILHEVDAPFVVGILVTQEGEGMFTEDFGHEAVIRFLAEVMLDKGCNPEGLTLFVDLVASGFGQYH
ncbi:MAG: hypothetical protein ACKVI3_18595, partial [Verrucomicrobiia bacterium]